MRHIAIIFDERPGPYIFALVVQKKPFSREQTFQLDGEARRRGLSPIWIPDQAQREEFGPYPQLASGAMDLNGFINVFRNFKTPLDISPSPDSRPFVLDLSLSTLPVFKQLTVFALVLALGVLAVSWKANAALESRAGSTPATEFDVLYVLYFLALGVGFMLVEIPLAQKLILPLGYPTLALTVILFSVLLGGGVGSWFSQRFEGAALRRYAMICALGVALYSGAGVLLLQSASEFLLPLPIVLRCVIAALLLLPLGFLLGTPFPSGLRLFAKGREHKVPLIWGLNGVASVVGSLLAAMGAKNFGFNAMLGIGGAIYIAAALLLFATQWAPNSVEAAPDEEA